MKNKFTKWLSCLAMLAALGMFTGCDEIASKLPEPLASLAGKLIPSDSASESPEEESSKESEENKPEDSGENKPEDGGENKPEDGGENKPEDGGETPTPAVTYTVTWKNEDGSVLETDEKVAKDATPSYDGATPAKDGDVQYAYEFAGWDKEITPVTGDVTYTATFNQVVRKYTVNFVNADGSTLYSAEVEYGKVPAYEGATPAKAADKTYTYEFAGWDNNVAEVTGEATYTATYNSKYIEYTIKFVSDNGSLISEKAYHYGEEVEVPQGPSKDAGEYFSYVFAGWDNEVVNVAGDATYTATYESTLKEGINANKVTAGVNDAIVLGAGEIGGGANYRKGQQEDTAPDDGVDPFVRQSYLALDGNYNLNDYVAFDFTGKNMPEVAFFAKNYNESMYAEGTSKQGIVVVTGITSWDGKETMSVNVDKETGKIINYDFPYMIQDTANGGFCQGAHAPSMLGRENLVDGTHYRVIMGFTGSGNAITLHWYLYNIDTKEVVEQSSMTTWNFFSGSNAQVGNMTINDLSGSIVLYGKFGIDCTIDKLYGVFEDATIEGIANGLNDNATSTVTFKDANGNVLKTIEKVPFGASVSYDEALPTPEKTEDALFTYSYAWDKAFGKVCGDTVYTLQLVSKAKDGYSAHNATAEGEGVLLASGSIGAGADYIKGQNAGGSINLAYLAIDGNYSFDDYLVLDFTGKNMPEVSFFSKNYTDSFYYEKGKQGVVVASGITLWNGTKGSAQSNNTKVGVSGPFGAWYEGAEAPRGGNMLSDFDAKLARENLEDGKQYRIIMGFTNGGNNFTLNYCLYNVTDGVVVETVSQTSWNFYTGSNDAVGYMKTSDLSGSIVLYGKFGTTCKIDKLYGVESGAFADVVAKYAK